MSHLENKIDNYVREILGIPWSIEGIWEHASSLPRAISYKYQIFLIYFESKRLLLACDTDFEDTPTAIAKQINLISDIAKCPVVYASNRITSYARKIFIKLGVSFVVPNQQIYLYPLGIYLKEKFPQEFKTEVLSPSAQVLFLHILKSGKDIYNITYDELVYHLQYSKMTISRACRELIGHSSEEIFSKSKTEIWSYFLKKLSSPVKKRIYLTTKVEGDFLESGLTALSKISDIESTRFTTFAMTEHELKYHNEWHKYICNKYEAISEVEIWKYNPRVLEECFTVDNISLYLSLKDYDDPRVESALEGILKSEGIHV